MSLNTKHLCGLNWGGGANVPTSLLLSRRASMLNQGIGNWQQGPEDGQIALVSFPARRILSNGAKPILCTIGSSEWISLHGCFVTGRAERLPACSVRCIDLVLLAKADPLKGGLPTARALTWLLPSVDSPVAVQV